MRMASRSTVESEMCTLFEVKSMIKHVRVQANHVNIKLRWKYKNGIYIGYMKYAGKIIYEKEYPNARKLLDVIIEMHFDFGDQLSSGILRKVLNSD